MFRNGPQRSFSHDFIFSYFWQNRRTKIIQKLLNSVFIIFLLFANVTGAVQAKPANSEHLRDSRQTSLDCVQAPDDLIAYWAADGDGRDVIGDHAATLVNGGTYGSGKYGQAFNLQGVTDYIDLGNWFTLQEFTISLWVQAGVSQQTNASIIDNDFQSGTNWGIWQNQDQINQYSWSGKGDFGLPENVWQHLVVSQDKEGSYKIYLDGAPVISGQYGPVKYYGTQFLRIGAIAGGARNWNGLIDEIKVFNRPLTSTEVSTLFAESGTSICNREIDLTKSDIEIQTPPSLRADGLETATLKVTVRNAESMPISNLKVVFDVAGGGTQIQYVNEKTDSNGIVLAHLTSTVPGLKSVRAGIITSKGTQSISEISSVVFDGGEISGVTYQDKNGNGQLDENENMIIGVIINLLDAQSEIITTTASKSDGSYIFDGLLAGNYQLEVEPYNSYDASTKALSVNLEAFQVSSGHNFGLFNTASVNGKVWDDVNQNKILDESEGKLSGVTVIGNAQDNSEKRVQTSEDGSFLLKLPAPEPAGPVNFSFAGFSSVIKQRLISQLYNSAFETEINSFDQEIFPNNYNYEQPSYQLDNATYPDNYDFEHPSYVLDSNTFPANYNFETGNLYPWEADSFSVIKDNQNASYVAYSPYWSGGVLKSSAFTIPADAQTLTWDWNISFAGDWWRSGAAFYLVDAETGKDLVTMYYNAGTSGTWQKFSFNVTSYRGKSVQFKMAKLDNRNDLYLDNIQLETNIPGWTLQGGMNGSLITRIANGGSAHNSLALYSPYSTDMTTISPAFTIPADAQTLTWDWNISFAGDWWRSGAAFYLVDAETGKDLVTMYYNAGTSGTWQKFSFNVTSYRGKSVQFKMAKLDNRNDLYLDNIQLETNIPGWTLQGGMNGSLITRIANGGSAHNSLALYSPYSTDMTTVSPAFTIPADAQTLTWDWNISFAGDWWRSGAAFYLVDAETGKDLVTMYYNAGTSGTWQKFSFNVTSYRGKSVQFKMAKLDNRNDLYLDNILITPYSTANYTITEENLPGYKSSTVDTVSQSLYGGQDININFGDFTIDLGKSILTAEPAVLIANGIEQTLVTVTIKDGLGIPMPEREVRIETSGRNVTVNQPITTTNTDGQVTAMLSSTVAQTVSVKARDILENVTLTDAKEVTFVPGSVDASHSTINVSPAYVSANGEMTATIVVEFKDAFDNPVPNRQVSLSHNGTDVVLNTSTPTTDEEGKATATISSTKTQVVTIEAQDLVTSLQLGSNAVVTFVQTDPSQSLVSISPSSTDTDNSSGVEILVSLKNAAGEPVANALVQIEVSGTGNSIDGQVIDNSTIEIGNTNENGDVVIHLASTKAETKNIIIYGEHIKLQQTAQIIFNPGVASATTSSFSIEPLKVLADGQQEAKVIVELKDSYSNPIPNHPIGLTANSTFVEFILPEPNETDENGQFAATIRSTSVGKATIIANALDEDIMIGQPIDVEFIAGPADSTLSVVETQAENLIANGEDVATITVTLKDKLEHLLSDHIVHISANGSGNIIKNLSSASTDENGVIAFTMASTRAEVKTITIIDATSGVTLANKPTISFAPGAISGEHSVLQIDKENIPADGITPATITVIAQDAQNNPISNATVTLTSTGSAQISTSTVQTDAMGKAVSQVIDAKNETVVIKANIDGTDLQKQATVHFLAADLSLNVTTPTKVYQNSILEYSVSVANTNYLSAEDVKLQVTLPGGVEFANDTFNLPRTVNGQTLSWELGSISPNEKISASVYVVIAPSISYGTTIDSKFELASSSIEESTANNAVNLSTMILDSYEFSASISPQTQKLAFGAEALYEIQIKNTGYLADQYHVSVDGLDAQQYSFSATDITLAPNETDSITLTLAPQSCAPTIYIPFSVKVFDTAQENESVSQADVTYQSEPIITDLRPENNIVLGSRDVTISWRTDTATTGVLSIFPIDNPGNVTTYPTTLGNVHSVVVPSLERNKTYSWAVRASSECGVTNSEARQFTVGNGVVFNNHIQAYTINRDYEQVVYVPVTNQDDKSHEIQLVIQENYDDLLVNFRGSGSIDKKVTLLPGETRNIELGIFAQDAMLENYVITGVLTADDGSSIVTDLATINVRVLFPSNYVIEKVRTDPLTNVTTYRVTNKGLPITDLTIDAVDTATDLPASVLMTPQIYHARLGTDASLEFDVAPLYSVDQVSAASGTVPDIKYSLKSQAAGKTKVYETSVSCGEGKKVYAVTFGGPGQGPIAVKFPFNTWYCPNRPNVLIQLLLPFFINLRNVLGGAIDLNIVSPGVTEPHDTSISLNGTQIGGLKSTIPNGNYVFPFDPSNLSSTGNYGSMQNVVINANFKNFAHYAIGTQGNLVVVQDQLTVFICASSAEEAAAIANSAYGVTPLPTSVNVDVISPTQDSTAQFGADGTINVKAYVSDNLSTYANLYAVSAEAKYLDVFLTPSDSFSLFDDGMPGHGDLMANDRYFNGKWTPRYGGHIELKVTAELPSGLSAVTTRTFFISAQPDFAVNDVYIKKITKAGEAVEVWAEITNNGFNASGPLVVEFRYYRATEDGTKIGSPIYTSRQELFNSIFDNTFERGEVETIKDDTFVAPTTNVYYVEVVVDPQP